MVKMNELVKIDPLKPIILKAKSKDLAHFKYGLLQETFHHIIKVIDLETGNIIATELKNTSDFENLSIVPKDIKLEIRETREEKKCKHYPEGTTYCRYCDD